jgi:hypothetical protein
VLVQIFNLEATGEFKRGMCEMQKVTQTPIGLIRAQRYTLYLISERLEPGQLGSRHRVTGNDANE